MYLPTLVPCLVSCVSGGSSYAEASLCCHHVRTSVCLCTGEVPCVVSCVSGGLSMLKRLSVATFALLCYPSLYTCVAALCQNLADFGGAIKNFTPVVLSATTTKSHGTEIATDLLRQWQQKS